MTDSTLPKRYLMTLDGPAAQMFFDLVMPPGTKTMGLHMHLTPVELCGTCGAVVAVMEKHNNWHMNLKGI